MDIAISHALVGRRVSLGQVPLSRPGLIRQEPRCEVLTSSTSQSLASDYSNHFTSQVRSTGFQGLSYIRSMLTIWWLGSGKSPWTSWAPNSQRSLFSTQGCSDLWRECLVILALLWKGHVAEQGF